MSSSYPNNKNNPNGGEGSCSSSWRPPDDTPIPIPPFQAFSPSEFDHEAAAGSLYYNHFPPEPDLASFSNPFLDHQSSSSFPNLPSLDRFGPFPSSLALHQTHVFHTPPPPSGTLGASAVVFVPPLSALPEGPQVGTSSDVLEATTASSDVAAEADHQPLSGGATVVTLTPPSPPTPPPPPLGNEAATGSATVTRAIPSLCSKRKRGRPRKCFRGDSSGTAGQGGRVAEAEAEAEVAPQAQAQETMKEIRKTRDSARKGKAASSSVLVNQANTAWGLGLGSKRNVIRPATIIVSEAEDVSEKIISFARDNGAVFVLAASGVLSSLEFVQPSRSTVQSFMGKFDILSLSGTLLLSKDGGLSRSGHLTVSVTGIDGRILGGRVHGSLIAASPVQIVGGTIAPAVKKGSKALQFEGDQILQLYKQISSMSQEWQARLDEQKREAEKTNQRLETTTKELNETRQELNETRQELNETRRQLNETRQQLKETRQTGATTQNLVMQLFERLNIVNPPPHPQPPPF